MKHFIFIIVGLCLSACVKIKDAQKDEPTDNPLDATPVSVLVQKPQIQEMEEPHHYKVLIPNLKGGQILRRKIKDTTNPFQILVVPSAADSYVDDQVVEGQTYIYEAGDFANDQFNAQNSFEVVIPQDLEIQNEIVLQKDEVWTQYRRIFLSSGVMVTTHGHQLMIQADQMIVRPTVSSTQPAIFRTFEPNAVAGLGVTGRSGGLIKILLRTGQGPLLVELRGENGGKGKDGQYGAAAPGNGEAGLSGGSTGRAEITVQEEHQLLVQPKFYPGIGGVGGRGTDAVTSTGYIPLITVLAGANGGTGPNGLEEFFCLIDLKNPSCEKP